MLFITFILLTISLAPTMVITVVAAGSGSSNDPKPQTDRHPKWTQFTNSLREHGKEMQHIVEVCVDGKPTKALPHDAEIGIELGEMEQMGLYTYRDKISVVAWSHRRTENNVFEFPVHTVDEATRLHESFFLVLLRIMPPGHKGRVATEADYHPVINSRNCHNYYEMVELDRMLKEEKTARIITRRIGVDVEEMHPSESVQLVYSLTVEKKLHFSDSTYVSPSPSSESSGPLAENQKDKEEKAGATAETAIVIDD